MEDASPETAKLFVKPGSMVSSSQDLSRYLRNAQPITLADTAYAPVPDKLPEEIRAAFIEGVKCLAIGCQNAASAMFRLCLDLATKSVLPKESVENTIEKNVKRDLSPRLRWLFDNKLLPMDLQEISAAVKDHGDVGVHYGRVDQEDAEDVYNFAYALLNRIFTERARIEEARKRMQERKKN